MASGTHLTLIFFFCRKNRGHAIQVLPLGIDKSLQGRAVIPDLSEAVLLLEVGIDTAAIGAFIDAVTAAVKYLVEWEQTAAHGDFDQLGALVRLGLPAGRAR